MPETQYLQLKKNSQLIENEVAIFPSQLSTRTPADHVQSETVDHNVTILENPEVLEVIREEQLSPSQSTRVNASKTSSKSNLSQINMKCLCGAESVYVQSQETGHMDAEYIANLLKERELQLRAEYDKVLERELEFAKERFDFILQNEQMRTTYMLREAHRERQEKIRALESQLQCKNLAGLMYVMCSERTRSKLEKARIIEDYTNYIEGLQELLMEGQMLILDLSRGYKTAARVDNEWREKMKKVVSEFMNFIYHFAGGPPETNQYFINLPNLLETKAAIVDDPEMDPYEEEPVEEEENFEERNRPKEWWETLEGDARPFVVFGDMADFMPPQRRQVLKAVNAVRAAKTAPKVWKEYVFNNMALKKYCENTDDIKDIMPNLRHYGLPPDNRSDSQDGPGRVRSDLRQSRASLSNNQQGAISKTLSLDVRGGDMGSILKIITSASAPGHLADKSALLGAKDSMEIASTTKLRHSKASDGSNDCFKKEIKEPEKLNIGSGKKKLSRFDAEVNEEVTSIDSIGFATTSEQVAEVQEEPADDSIDLNLTIPNDSLDVMQAHVPDVDHKINYERVCPVETCQRLQVDSFMRSLPPYMSANPFTYFQQTYEAYETCTPEQLKILKQRMAAKQEKDYSDPEASSESVLLEWDLNMATQTSDQSITELCNCMASSTTPADNNFVFNLRDLIPVKQLMDAIQKECLFDEHIQFDRFKVVGQENDHSAGQKIPEKQFKQARAKEIVKILRQHPSLLDIFQANTRC